MFVHDAMEQLTEIDTSNDGIGDTPEVVRDGQAAGFILLRWFGEAKPVARGKR